MEILHCEKFDLVIREDDFSILTEDAEVFRFQVRTAVHRHCSAYADIHEKNESRDADTAPLTCSITREGDTCTAVWTTSSRLWQRKEYILECDSKCFRYYVRVYGSGSIGQVDYFGLGRNAYDASGYMIPSATELFPHPISRAYVLQLGLMTPPPLCYSFFTEGIDTRVGISLVARPGKYNFDQFGFNPHYPDHLTFSTNYWGYSSVSSECFETAHILGMAADSDLDVLAKYRDYSFDYGYAVRRTAPKYDWWKKPIFCGWGQQGEHADLVEGNPTDRKVCATQAVYTKMAQRIEERELPITTIIIDDKWQEFYGIPLPDPKKWPDMRKFVDEQHARGRKVVLWYKVWNGEGLMENEQVECLCRPVGADPTSQKYIAHMKEAFYKILSPDEGCYDCDGFKFDFANCMPLGENLYIDQWGVYGFELLKRMYTLLYECTKAVKPDALVNNSCCNPYFAEVTDQVRLHDYACAARSARAILDNRFSVFSTVMHEASVDTDAPGGIRYRDTMRYMEYAMELGVPALYFVDHPLLSDEDWARVKGWMEAYLERLGD